ncbi:MAG: outer membrane lipoprotein carrier protein LolA [Pseudomonadota bacterium]
MQRRTLLLTAAAAIAMGQAAKADPISLDRLNAYFNGFTTASGDFTQYNSDGSTSTGTLYLQRPGRARFEYNGSDALVMAGGGQVAVFDGRSNVEPQQFPLNRTPLGLILARNVDLSRSRMVFGHQEVEGRTLVQARDPKQPEIGHIDLYFLPDPVRLDQWTITDETGARTAVVLKGLQTGANLPSTLFNIPIEQEKRR